MNLKLVPQRLKQAREQSGLTQKSVAEMLGMHRPSLSKIESGEQRVYADQIALLAELYRVSPRWLLGCEDDIKDLDDPRIGFAVEELKKLKPADVDVVLAVISSMLGKGKAQTRCDRTRTENDDSTREPDFI